MAQHNTQDAPRKTSEGHAYKILSGMPEGQDARALAEKARTLMAQDRVLVHVALDDARLSTLTDLLDFFAPDVKYATFPAWDCLPYDRVSPHNEVVAQRVATLGTLLGWEKEKQRYPRILLTTVNAISKRVPPRAAMESHVLNAQRGGALDRDALQLFLQRNGYQRVDTVREPGEYAIRGGIIDLFPPGYEEPLRIDLFGIEIDSIRAFDP